jgi:2-methylcitrate dehydratase
MAWDMTLAKDIADYAVSLSYDDLGSEVIKETKRRIVDAVGVSFGALDAKPVKIARSIVNDLEHGYRASVLGSSKRAPLEEAVFANGCAVRYLDFNDTYLSKEAMHPSDNIPAMMAVAEAEGKGGEEIILGTVLAYDVACHLADASSIRDRGWDHVTYIAISSAVGASRIMSLNSEQTTQAINLAATPNVALRQTRAGELSMWKGCAAANAIRNGVFASLLAKNGMTGPSPVFEGEMGFFRQVAGEFVLDMIEGQHKIVQTHVKNYPVEYHAMSAVDAVLKIRKGLGGSDVKELRIDTFTVGWKIIAKDPEKWNPQTKETADHSLPYIVDRALLDGDIWLDSYDQPKIEDDKVKKLLKMTKVNVDPAYDSLYPGAVPNRVTVKSDGDSEAVEVIYPKGHCKNPLTDDEIQSKYIRLGAPKDALSRLWNIERYSAGDVMQLLKGVN